MLTLLQTTELLCSYKDIQNVVALLESGTGSQHALLLNCHFDSVPQSPGQASKPYIESLVG